MKLRVCRHCQNHYQPSLSSECPHCVETPDVDVSNRVRPSIAWLLGLGLGLTACGEDEKDTSQQDTSQRDTSQEEPAAEPTAEPSDEALYGVPNNG